MHARRQARETVRQRDSASGESTWRTIETTMSYVIPQVRAARRSVSSVSVFSRRRRREIAPRIVSGQVSPARLREGDSMNELKKGEKEFCELRVAHIVVDFPVTWRAAQHGTKQQPGVNKNQTKRKSVFAQYVIYFFFNFLCRISKHTRQV